MRSRRRFGLQRGVLACTGQGAHGGTCEPVEASTLLAWCHAVRATIVLPAAHLAVTWTSGKSQVRREPRLDLSHVCSLTQTVWPGLGTWAETWPALPRTSLVMAAVVTGCCCGTTSRAVM